MCAATQSEPIARMKRCSNEWDRSGAKTLRGWACLQSAVCRRNRQAGAKTDRDSEAQGNPKARGRRSGEILAKVFVANPERAKPKGAASGRYANHVCAVRDSRKGQNPGTAACRAGPVFRTGYTGGRNGKWVLPGGNVRIPFARRKLRRVNPMSAAGAKQNRRGIEGRKPSRGQPNPEGGTERVGKTREKWTSDPVCCREQKPMRGAGRCGGAARVCRVRLSWRLSSMSGFAGSLKRIPA
jgi:hypothetical protein